MSAERAAYGGVRSANLTVANNTAVCAVCGTTERLLRCVRCHEAVYCGRRHQREDWPRHKTRCRAPDEQPPAVTSEGSSESEILSACAQSLSPSSMPDYAERERPRREFVEVPLPPYMHSALDDTEDPFRDIVATVVADMNQYGVCVLDDFLGPERGGLVLEEVLAMYAAGTFQDGQLVSRKVRAESKTIRGDQIVWSDGKTPNSVHIGQLIQQVDGIIMRANRMANNGKMGDYVIRGRTKAMVACYPGSGTHYVKHVDNPNKDGRCITAIYYLNRHWDVATCGGLLRIFPQGWSEQVADIVPVFDRILFFWSDRRNPHEVQPAYQTRYAITLWYFDVTERQEATRRVGLRHAQEPTVNVTSLSDNLLLTDQTSPATDTASSSAEQIQTTKCALTQMGQVASHFGPLETQLNPLTSHFGQLDPQNGHVSSKFGQDSQLGPDADFSPLESQLGAVTSKFGQFSSQLGPETSRFGPLDSQLRSVTNFDLDSQLGPIASHYSLQSRYLPMHYDHFASHLAPVTSHMGAMTSQYAPPQ